MFPQGRPPRAGVVPAAAAGAGGVGAQIQVAAGGLVRAASVRVVLGHSLSSVAASPVAVSVLAVAQRLSGRTGRVSEVLIRPSPGAEASVHGELARLVASAHLDLRPATDELRLLSVATAPNRQSTSLFTAIAVMIGFLLALNAMLLTVPERRRFIAELITLGYDPRQVVLLMGLQALVLGLAASVAGMGLGYLLSHVFFAEVPGFLTAAFPIGAEEVVRSGSVLAALACGLLATALASFSPLFDLRSGRPADRLSSGAPARGEAVSTRSIRALGAGGLTAILCATTLALLAPRLTVLAGVLLALGCLCLVPAVLFGLSRMLPHALEGVRSGALVVALTELRATTLRAIALAGIVCLAVFGGIAIGGARSDLLRGIGDATTQYFATAPVWVTSGRDVFNTNSFDPRAPLRALARASGGGGASARPPGGGASGTGGGGASARRPDGSAGGGAIASVRVYRGGLLDLGERRVWVRARPAADSAVIESSQLVHGSYERASRLIRAGGWVAVSSDIAQERHLHVGSVLALPTPTGTAPVRVAAITTNSGWPAGAITMSSAYYARLWGSPEAAAFEVSLRPGVSAAQGRRAVAAALGPFSGLRVLTASERAAQSAASARQGLRTLAEISTLLLVAAALSVASALSAAIWQRRARLASLKMQGYDTAQLWRAVLIESAVVIGAGAFVGAAVGVVGHALAGRFLALTTGFPAPFAAGPLQLVGTVGLFGAIALVVIALPGMAAARVSPRTLFQE